jgi:hypothetical protein
MDAAEEQPLKAYSPTEEADAGTLSPDPLSDVSPEQPLKAYLPIDEDEPGTETEVMKEQLTNAATGTDDWAVTVTLRIDDGM